MGVDGAYMLGGFIRLPTFRFASPRYAVVFIVGVNDG